MPRLSNSLLRYARHINPLLPLLLRTCRDLSSARNELRWLREHILTSPGASSPSRPTWQGELYRLCLDRSKGKPLQYILGNQPFGDLDITCRPGVLIPRSVYDALKFRFIAKNAFSPETEAYTTHLAKLVCKNITKWSSADSLPPCPPQLRILDLCTGTGCIPLLLHALLSSLTTDLLLHGVDISSNAVALAKQNLRWNIGQTHLQQVANDQVTFSQGDIFHLSPILEGKWDILVSNPPYISPHSFARETSHSVRKFEPKMALVPPDSCAIFDGYRDALKWDLAVGDAFYPRLLEIAIQVNAKLFLVEVADMEQAKRVAALASKSGQWDEFQIWRDWPEQGAVPRRDVLKVGNETVEIIGEGHGRSVFLSRAGGIKVLGLGDENML